LVTNVQGVDALSCSGKVQNPPRSFWDINKSVPETPVEEITPMPFLRFCLDCFLEQTSVLIRAAVHSAAGVIDHGAVALAACLCMQLSLRAAQPLASETLRSCFSYSQQHENLE